jgi:hypothetical protein
MKKYNILKIGIVAFIIILPLSCQKSNKSLQIEKSCNSNYATVNYIVDPSNNLNELDFVGQLHNECLDIQANVLIDAMHNGISQSDAKQLIKTLTAQKLNSYFKSSINADNLTFTDNFKEYQISNEKLTEKSDPIGFLRQKNALSENIANLFILARQSIKPNLDSINTLTINVKHTVNNAINKLKEIELNNIHNASFSAEEQTQIKIFFSVLRHSIVYHITNATNEKSPWAIMFQKSEAQKSIIYQKTWQFLNGFMIYADWTDIGVQDGIWGVSGGGAGSYGGLGGALVGAIFGCAGGSASALWTQMNAGGVIIIAWGVVLWP